MLDQRREENINLEEKKELYCSNSKTSSNDEVSETLFSQSHPPPKANPACEGKGKRPPQPQNPEADKLAALLLAEIQKNAPKFPAKQAQLRQWSLEADRMIRLDRRTPEEIAAVITWAQSDDFEMKNVLSMAKVRKRFDQLQLKSKAAARPFVSRADRETQEFIRRHSQ